MTVFVVLTAYDNDPLEVVAVFANREAAKAYAADYSDDEYRVTVCIKEWQVQTGKGGFMVQERKES
jgi:hypothetical protein